MPRCFDGGIVSAASHAFVNLINRHQRGGWGRRGPSAYAGLLVQNRPDPSALLKLVQGIGRAAVL